MLSSNHQLSGDTDTLVFRGVIMHEYTSFTSPRWINSKILRSTITEGNTISAGWIFRSGKPKFVSKDLCLNQVGSMIKTSPGKKIPFSCFFCVELETKKRLEEKDGLRLPPSLSLDWSNVIGIAPGIVWRVPMSQPVPVGSMGLVYLPTFGWFLW